MRLQEAIDVAVMVHAGALATGVLLLGRTPEAHLATHLIPSHAAGLAGQIVFAAFPWMQGVWSGRSAQAAG